VRAIAECYFSERRRADDGRHRRHLPLDAHVFSDGGAATACGADKAAYDGENQPRCARAPVPGRCHTATVSPWSQAQLQVHFRSVASADGGNR
jgi:hypothetical protein